MPIHLAIIHEKNGQKFGSEISLPDSDFKVNSLYNVLSSPLDQVLPTTICMSVHLSETVCPTAPFLDSVGTVSGTLFLYYIHMRQLNTQMFR